jgi:hypothetical protein
VLLGDTSTERCSADLLFCGWPATVGIPSRKAADRQKRGLRYIPSDSDIQGHRLKFLVREEVTRTRSMSNSGPFEAALLHHERTH